MAVVTVYLMYIRTFVKIFRRYMMCFISCKGKIHELIVCGWSTDVTNVERIMTLYLISCVNTEIFYK